MIIAPYEMYEEPTWEILDPNNAKLIATFYDAHEAEEYLNYLNKRDLPGRIAQAQDGDTHG